MELKNLGWNIFFENNFTQYKKNGFIAGRVFREEKSIYDVFTERGELRARLAGKIRYKAHSKSDFPVVGDWVVIIPTGEKQGAIIHSVLPRKTMVSRKIASGRKRESGGKTEEQVIAANIDTIFIVCGLDRDYNLRRIERYLTLVYNSGAMPVILLNKADLCADVDSRVAEVETITFDVPIHAFSALQPTALVPLMQYLKPGRTVALLGSSGVGKSTIINGLLGQPRQEVQEISVSVGKGVHTTSSRELILFPDGGILMDNPGMREIQLWGESGDLQETFYEIEELAQNCRFNDCQHKAEPGCAVKKAIEDGELEPERLSNYHKMLRELTYLEERQHKPARLVEREKWQNLFKEHFKEYPKK